MKECLYGKCTVEELYNKRHHLKSQKFDHAFAIVDGPNDLSFAEEHYAEIQRLQEEIDAVSQQMANCLTCPGCTYSEMMEIENGRVI